MVVARFDGAGPGDRRSFALGSHLATFQTVDPDGVGEVLARAEAEVHQGNWVAGWVSYEAAPGVNPTLTVVDSSASSFADLPLAWFAVFEERGSAPELPSAGYTIGEWLPTIDETGHGEDIEEIHRLIRAGDVYQVNHTFRMSAGFGGSSLSFYGDLVRPQNGGYGAFLDAGRWQVVSASPELFFDWRDGVVVSRPMKGTIRRGRDNAEDRQMRDSLISSVKDRAENVMIVDMVRNDLGRIARPGTVEVPTLFAAEKYDTVWQLTSTVTAVPRDGTTLGEVFAALFPAASITGAPKVSAMESISRLEADPRGVYCGAVGFGGPGDNGEPRWRFNVAIRTATIDQSASRCWYGTGGGITIESTRSGEYAEAVLKTQILARRDSEFDLIETIRWTPQDGFHLLERHVERVLESASYFDIPLSAEGVRSALEEAVVGAAIPIRVRMSVSRQGRIDVDTGPMPAATSPITLAVDEVPVDSTDPFLRHKTSRRGQFEAARARHPDVDDVILVNERGELTETTIANLVLDLDGRWVTPPVDSGCLPGVERAQLISTGEVIERVIYPGDLDRAKGLARVNSLRGWEPAVVAGTPATQIRNPGLTIPARPSDSPRPQFG